MKIYVSGSIYGGTEKIETYKILIKELEKYGEVLTKQIADIIQLPMKNMKKMRIFMNH